MRSTGEHGAGRDRRHRILVELGRGGMGTVYLALSLGPAGFRKLKVLKRLRPELAADPDFATMFLDEARLAARLNHPNIVQTNEVGADGRDYFMEMEYLEGQSVYALQRRAAGRGGLPLPLGVSIVTQAFAGLHYAHQLTGRGGAPLGIVHRDVSPHNLFVTYEGAVKVLDFGIAKAADAASQTGTGMVKGKVTYMAPEQAAHRATDHRADIYSLGIVLWEVLAGRRLWEKASDREIMDRLELGRIDPPSTVAREVPPAIEAICMRCLELEPERRYATAADAQIALEKITGSAVERVGARELGAYVSDLFDDVRRAVAQQIEARIALVERSAPHVEDAEELDPPVVDTGAATTAPLPPGDGRKYVLAASAVALAVAALAGALAWGRAPPSTGALTSPAQASRPPAPEAVVAIQAGSAPAATSSAPLASTTTEQPPISSRPAVSAPKPPPSGSSRVDQHGLVRDPF